MISKERIIALVFIVCFQYCTGQGAHSFDWCDQSLNCGPQKNTMCIMSRKESTEDCFFMEDVMTAEDKRLMLAMHNTVRDQLAAGDIQGWPSASDMRQMSWDDTLAMQATLWAFQCNQTSDPCPRNPFYPKVGQASIEVGDTDDFPDVKAIFRKMVMMGKDGAKLVDKWDSNPLSGAKEGYRNFHQVIYARETVIGCGLVRYLKTKKSKGGKKVAVFTLSLWCNYGAGLQSGEKVYTKGDPCKACPDKTQCKPDSIYPHLCATSDDPIYATFEDVIQRGNCHRVNPTAFLILFSILSAAMEWNSEMKH